MNQPSPTTFRKSFDLPAGIDLAFDAIIEPEHLRRWFAEHVEIEPRPGGKYRFWGKHSPWTAMQTDANQVITHIDPPRRLGFAWTWRGCRCDVMLELSEIAGEGNRSQLLVHQTCAGRLWPAEGEDAAVMGDFWKLFAGNLRSYLSAGKPAIRPDFTPKRGEVRVSIEIDAPPREVFRALSVPAQMDRWLSKQAYVELRPGGAYTYGWTTKGKDGSTAVAGPARIIEIVPDQLIVHDWMYSGEPPTRVRWELEPIRGGNATRVTLTHTKFDDETTHGGYVQGWAAFLVALKELAEEVQTPLQPC